jgi:hypothetical protein
LRCLLYLAFAHLLLALHVHRPALLLHLHRALLLHLLLAGLLLCGLRAFALLRLHLRLPLLLHLLLAGLLLCGLRAFTLLRLHLRLPLLLHLLLARTLLGGLLALRLRLHLRLPGLLFACALLCLLLKLALLLFALLRLVFPWTLLRGRAIAGGLRRALDRPHHGQAPRLLRVALRFVCGPDHRGTRQGPAFAGMREARAGQFARAPDGLRRLVARGYRMHRVLERFRLAGATGRLGGSRHRRGTRRSVACCRFCRARRHGAAARVSDGRHQLDAVVAGRHRRTRLAQILHLRRGERLAVLPGDHFFTRREVDWPRRWLVSRHHRPRKRFAAL